jgi:putative addiction module killer protein
MNLTIKEYLSAEKRNYFREWLDTLTAPVKARIQARILRFEMGNFGDRKSIGGGVWEARVMFDPGYRIYFGKDGRFIIALLLGGDKSSQGQDIRKAQLLWKEYLEGTDHGATD